MVKVAAMLTPTVLREAVDFPYEIALLRVLL